MRDYFFPSLLLVLLLPTTMFNSFIRLILSADLLRVAAVAGGIQSSMSLNSLIAKSSLQSICENGFERLRIPKGPIEVRVEKAASVLLAWAYKGLPDTRATSIYRFCRMWQSILLEWLFHLHFKGHRTSKPGWQLACTFAHMLGLHNIWFFHGKVKIFRVMLRSLEKVCKNPC